MSKVIKLFSLTLFLAISIFSCQSKDDKVHSLVQKLNPKTDNQIKQAIDFTLTDINGKKVSLKDYRGKVVFLNFWLTYCPMCMAEMPVKQKLYEKMKGKDFEMIAISFDKQSESVTTFIPSTVKFPVLLDPKAEIKAKYKVRGVPTTFIIDKDGTVIGQFKGSRHWDRADSLQLFTHLVDRNVKFAFNR